MTDCPAVRWIELGLREREGGGGGGGGGSAGGLLTLPMLRLLSCKLQGSKRFLKT